MAVVDVAVSGREYDVQIGPDLLFDLDRLAAPFLHSKHAVIVADENAHTHWGAPVTQSLARAAITPHWYLVPSGEAQKSWQRLDDLTGFACAILKRGCGFIQLPTTLLAQVDSSVGGKTAINCAAGKNLIGAFYQPSLVLADTGTLATLPPREMRAGYAEVLKYGVLGDAQFFTWLEENGDQVLAGDAAALEHAVTSSVAAKAQIVVADERETKGQRALLNLGHTFGHALESETGYSSTLLHGEAVALGMVLAARYSMRRGHLDSGAVARITQAVEKSGLPTQLATLGLACKGVNLVEHMRHDKKMDGDTLPFILLRGIGAACLAHDVQLDDVTEFLDQELQRD